MPANAQCKLVNIEQELKSQREQKQGPNVTNACLFNLIIYCQQKERIAYLQEMLHMILDRFPCRILFVQGSDEKDCLKASVSAQVVGKGSLAISCEQINIEASGSQLRRVPFILLPHIIPDLPVHLLWWEDPTRDNEILPQLEKFVTRLIFDSETGDDLQRFATQLLLRLDTSTKEVIDMNWARLSSWRTIVGQVFTCHSDLEQLYNSKAIIITYNARETSLFQHSAIQAIYMQGWLAAQLGWTFDRLDQKNGNTVITYRNGDQLVTVTLAPQEVEALSPGTLISIDITTRDEQHYLLHRVEGTRLIRIATSNAESCALPYTLPLSNQERGVQFLRELFYQPAGTHYKNMLHAVANLRIQG